MADISFNIACKELKIAQIAQLNQLFQLLHLVCVYGQGFPELSRMVNEENCKQWRQQRFAYRGLWCCSGGIVKSKKFSLIFGGQYTFHLS